MVIKLGMLSIDNFKGCKHFEHDFKGLSAEVYGANAVGKSTLADSVSWILTGKDQDGRADYEILPIGSAEGVESSVSATFVFDDGMSAVLHRVYKPVFTRKRGEAEKHYAGNTTDYYINDVPQKAKDYSKYIEEHFGTEDDILTATRPNYFASVLKPDARRQRLLDLFAGSVDDASVIANHTELAELADSLDGNTVENAVKRWKAQRKKVNDDKASIPGRIDEAERAKPDVQDLEGDSARLPHLAAQRLKINGKIDALKSGESASNLRQQVSKLQADMEQARAEYICKSSGENKVLENQMAALRQELVNAQAAAAKHNASAESKDTLVESLNQELKDLRNKAREIHGRQFDESSCICQTCRRPYPPEQVDEIRRNFNEKKAKESETTTAHGKSLKATYEDMTEQAEADRTAAQQDQAEAEHLQQELTALQKMLVTPPAWETTAAHADYQKQISDVQHSLESISSAADVQLKKLQDELEPVEAEMQAIQQRKTNVELVGKQNKRIAELKKEEKSLGVQLAQFDNLLYMADQFVQLKAADVQAEVNGSFSTVQWKLFDIQKNEGIKACCEAQVNGKDYGSLSKSEKVNAGLDIVNTLGKKMGLIMPVWHDDAESVSHPMKIEAQTIHLNVSDKDRTLRIEEAEDENL